MLLVGDVVYVYIFSIIMYVSFELYYSLLLLNAFLCNVSVGWSKGLFGCHRNL